MKYTTNALLCTLSAFFYTVALAAEQIIPKVLMAYLTASKVNFSQEDYIVNLAIPKAIFLLLSIVFACLAIYCLIVERRKLAK